MEFLFNLSIIIADQFMLFVVNVLVARHVGEELFGNFSVAINGLLLIATVVTLGVDTIVAYYFPKLFAKKKFSDMVQLARSIRHFLTPIHLTIFSLGLLLALSIFATSIAFKNLQVFELHHPLFLFFWGATAISLYNIFVQLFRSIGYMRTGILLSLLQTTLYFILAITVYHYYHLFMPKDYLFFFPHVMLLGFIGSYFLTVILCFYLFKRIAMPFQARFKSLALKSPFEWQKKIYGYMIQNLNIYVFSTIPLLTIEWMGHNEKSVGLFAAVVSIISLAFIGISPLGILIAPEISAALASSKQVLLKTIRKSVGICLSTGLIITLIFALFGRQILLLYQAKFIDALPYLYICLINIVAYAINLPLSRIIQYSKYGDKWGAKLTMIFIIVQMFASIGLIKLYGIYGAIMCYVGVNLMYTFAMVIITRKIYNKHNPAEFDKLT